MMTMRDLVSWSDSFNKEWTDAEIEIEWYRGNDVPCDPETGNLEEEWFGFPVGTPRMTVWKWVDETHSKGLASFFCKSLAQNEEVG